jgi:hypothetical protein
LQQIVTMPVAKNNKKVQKAWKAREDITKRTASDQGNSSVPITLNRGWHWWQRAPIMAASILSISCFLKLLFVLMIAWSLVDKPS